MEKLANLPRKKLYILLLTCAAVILAASFEVLLLVKDRALYDLWAAAMQEMRPDLPASQFSFDQYVASGLFQYLMRVLTPMVLGLHAYFAFVKLRVNSLFIFIWAVLLAGGAAYALTGANVHSPFFYVIMAGYAVLFLTVLSLHDQVSGAGKG